MNAKVLLIRCGPCVIIPVRLYILFMSLTVLLSERGFQPWSESDHDDRRGIKPRSPSHFVSEELQSVGPFIAREGGEKKHFNKMIIEERGPSELHEAMFLNICRGNVEQLSFSVTLDLLIAVIKLPNGGVRAWPSITAL